MATIKRGSSFVATIVFTENEWNGVYPWEDFVATVGQQSLRYDIEYEIDANNRTVMIESDTSFWKVGPASFDVRITKDGRIISVPNGYSIDLSIIEGISL